MQAYTVSGRAKGMATMEKYNKDAEMAKRGGEPDAVEDSLEVSSVVVFSCPFHLLISTLFGIVYLVQNKKGGLFCHSGEIEEENSRSVGG